MLTVIETSRILSKVSRLNFLQQFEFVLSGISGRIFVVSGESLNWLTLIAEFDPREFEVDFEIEFEFGFG